MMHLDQRQLNSVRDPNTEGAATISRILADGGIPSAFWGLIAASYYRGGLCPLVCIPTATLAVGAVDVVVLRHCDRTLSSLSTILTKNEHSPFSRHRALSRPCPKTTRGSDRLLSSIGVSSRRRTALATVAGCVFALPCTSFPELETPSMMHSFLMSFSIPPRPWDCGRSPSQTSCKGHPEWDMCCCLPLPLHFGFLRTTALPSYRRFLTSSSRKRTFSYIMRRISRLCGVNTWLSYRSSSGREIVARAMTACRSL